MLKFSEHGVTANMLALGASDSGFESRCSDLVMFSRKEINNLKTKVFQKKKEDFVCENCGKEVLGNGFTNHCPICLYSKHVDINPGDRQDDCGGLMKPVGLENKGDVFYIIHECLICKKQRKNKASKGDNFDKLIEISKNKNS